MPPRDTSVERLAVRLLFLLCVGLSALFLVEVSLDLWRSGLSWHDLAASPRAGQALASTVSRAFNNLTAMVLTFIALAVPITANMYTPKLIEIFVRDRVNVAVMIFYAGCGAHAVFVQATMFDQWSPAVEYTLLAATGVIGFVVLIPYYFYVLNFLNPSTIIRRVEDMVLASYAEVLANARPVPEMQERLGQRILNLGNVILRAVDRADRDVSIEAIHALEDAIVRYDDVKRRALPVWFEPPHALFPGASADAVAYMAKDRVWVEQKCLSQLELAYAAALAKMPDAVSAISLVNRRMAVYAAKKGDEGLLMLCIRFLNTFVREAVKKKDVHAIYDVYSQYTQLARELLPLRPDAVVEIARYFQYYADFARVSGMPFVHDIAASDLALVVETAFAQDAPVRDELLEVFLAFEADKSSARIVRAQVLVAAALCAANADEAQRLVAARLAAAASDQLAAARRMLLGTTDPIFWEVTDRQRNLDYVEPERRPFVQRVLDEAEAKKRGG